MENFICCAVIVSNYSLNVLDLQTAIFREHPSFQKISFKVCVHRNKVQAL